MLCTEVRALNIDGRQPVLEKTKCSKSDPIVAEGDFILMRWQYYGATAYCSPKATDHFMVCLQYAQC